MKKKIAQTALAIAFAGSLLSSGLQAFDCSLWGDGCCEDKVYGEAEYLYWKMKDSPRVIDLVDSGADTILGGNTFDHNWRSGERFTLGYWFDDDHCLGIEAGYFILPEESRSKSVEASGLAGSDHLTIPFYDVTIPGESSTGLAAPGVFSGKATLKALNTLQGAELNGLLPLSSCGAFDITFLAGFRWWNFNERVRFSTSSPFINTTDVFKTQDKFHAENNFYGGQVGLALKYDWDCFSLDLKGKVALGAMCEEAIIKGHLATSDFTGFTTVQHFDGGYFALPTNSGRGQHNCFSVIPEANVRLNYKYNECFGFQVGYAFTYVSQMLRAAKEMDPKLNPTQSVAITGNPSASLVGEASPKARIRSTSFWVQGLTAGVNFSF